jgi:hypothetical protein
LKTCEESTTEFGRVMMHPESRFVETRSPPASQSVVTKKSTSTTSPRDPSMVTRSPTR